MSRNPHALALNSAESGRSTYRRLFSAQGRIGRRDYWLISFASVVALILLAWLVGYLTGPSSSGSTFSSVGRSAGESDEPSPIVSMIGWGIVIVGFIALVVIGWCTEIKRFHDLGWPGGLTLLTLIPIAGLIFLVFTLFVSGNSGANKYGKPHSGTPFHRRQ